MTRTPINQAQSDSTAQVEFRRPTRADGADLWRLARDSGGLDLNSPYAYILWSDQFAKTSLIADVDGQAAGFVTGFLSPDNSDVLFIWQVAVASTHRGKGLAGRMLDALVDRLRPNAVEATVTPSNSASQRLFRGFARRHGCACREEPYLEPKHFPDRGHESEVLFHIGPTPDAQ